MPQDTVGCRRRLIFCKTCKSAVCLEIQGRNKACHPHEPFQKYPLCLKKLASAGQFVGAHNVFWKGSRGWYALFWPPRGTSAFYNFRKKMRRLCPPTVAILVKHKKQKKEKKDEKRPAKTADGRRAKRGAPLFCWWGFFLSFFHVFACLFLTKIVIFF